MGSLSKEAREAINQQTLVSSHHSTLVFDMGKAIHLANSASSTENDYS